MAYIEKHGKGWRVRYRLPSGKYATDPEKFDTKTAAKHRAEAVEAEMRAQTFTDPRLTTVTMGEYVPGWFERMRFETPNEASKRSHWRVHIEPRWGHREFRSINRKDVQKWIREMQDAGLSGRNIQAIYGTFRQIIRHAQVDDHIVRNPCVLIELPDSSPDKEREAATPLEILRLAAACGPFFPLIIATAYTGCRWGEVTGAKRDLVREHRGNNARRPGRRLYVHNRAEPLTGKDGKPRKGASYRDLALPDWLAEIYDAQLALHDCAYVFPSPRGKLLRPKYFRQYWVPARQRVRPGFDFHELRHSHETWMEEDDIPEVLRNKRMGHKSGKMSQHYAHVTADMEERLMKALTLRWEESLAAMGVEDWRELWTPEALPGYRKAA